MTVWTYHEVDEDELDGIDPGIREAVRVLRAAGVETYESCQGGEGHALPEPTILFHGGLDAGWHALAAALANGLPLYALRRCWTIDEGEPTGPRWELVLRRAVDAES